MIKLLFVFFGVVVSVSPLERAFWASTSRLRIARFTDMQSEVTRKITKEQKAIDNRVGLAAQLGCSEYPKTNVPRDQEFSKLFWEVTDPGTRARWNSFSESRKAILCNVLFKSIENTREKVPTLETHLELIKSTLRMYLEIEFEVEHKPEIPEWIIQLLAAGEAFERVSKMRDTLIQILRRFHNGHFEKIDFGMPLWPVSESEPLLRDLMTEVFADGSGEDKIDLFLRKLDFAGKMTRNEIYQMANNILKQFGKQIASLDTKVYTLEKEALLSRV